MDQRRQDLALTWVEVAEIAGLTYAGLRLIRTTTRQLQQDSKDGIERALRWAPNSIDAILAGGAPTPTEPVIRQATATPTEYQTGDEPGRPGAVGPEVVLDHLHGALALGGAEYFWQAMIRMNRLHNPLWVEPIQHMNGDRTA